jgi:hypothetical protein
VGFAPIVWDPFWRAIRIARRRNELERRRKKQAVQNSLNPENDTVFARAMQN